jgi:hypothetical protein
MKKMKWRTENGVFHTVSERDDGQPSVSGVKANRCHRLHLLIRSDNMHRKA